MVGSAGTEPGAQARRGLIDGGSGGAGLAQRVEQHEVVDVAVIAHGGYRHARSAQLGGICLSFVPQDVGLVNAQQCRRQPGDLLDAWPGSATQ